MRASKQNNYDRLVKAEVAKHLPRLAPSGHTAKTLTAELHGVIVKAKNRWNPKKGEDLGSWIFIYVRGYLKDLAKKKQPESESLDAIVETAAMSLPENTATLN